MASALLAAWLGSSTLVIDHLVKATVGNDVLVALAVLARGRGRAGPPPAAHELGIPPSPRLGTRARGTARRARPASAPFASLVTRPSSGLGKLTT